MTYAEIVVNQPMERRITSGKGYSQEKETLADYKPLGLTFHYKVPEALQSRLRPGHLVWVPFGTRRLQGVVVGLHEVAPVADTRPIEGLVYDRPVMTPAQLELARWISAHYLAPLLEAIKLFLPAGLAQRVETLLELASEPPWPTDLSPEQKALLEYLAQKPARLRLLKKKRPELTKRKVVDPLVRRGLITRRAAVVDRPLRPKTDRRVRLVADEATIAKVLPTLGRASVQADVLQWLVASQDPLPTLTRVCQAVGCSKGPVQALADRGWVEITSRRQLLLTPLSQEQVDGLVDSELGRAHAQTAILTTLSTASGPVPLGTLRDRPDFSPSALRALEKRGYVQRVVEEPQVLLRLSPAEVPAKVAELRGSDRYRSVLEALRSAGEPVWIGWLYAQTNTNLSVLRALEEAGLISLEEEVVWRDPLEGREFVPDTPPLLTSDQEQVWEEVQRGLEASRQGQKAPVYLLHGVTGSGKTEIYLRAIDVVRHRGQQAIVLVPEIALTPQTIRRFAARFSDRVAVWHSQLSPGERYDTWRKLRDGGADVVVGSRSALFVPFPNLGLIVVDEEHETSYKQERAPRYHARDVAIRLGEIAGVPVILGSATPDLSTYFAAQQGHIQLLELPQRIMGHRQRIEEQQARFHIVDTRYQPVPGMSDARTIDLPPVQVVDMRQELRAGNRSIFSRALQQALAQALEAGEQAILFLNRRGTATFVMCRDCGYVLTCSRCGVPLTYHRRENALICHHCGRQVKTPDVCPNCGSRRIRYFGAGTERVEAEVQRMFPQARTLRWDADVTTRKGDHEAIMARFVAHDADVLIGTQMIAKGLDLPLVTLVGVVAADVGLHLPDFRAGERTFQLLTQVAGRAGRGLRGGRVILQTYSPDHYAIRAASHHDYLGFYQQELFYRRTLGYPPYQRLLRLIFVHSNRGTAKAEAEHMVRVLQVQIDRLGEQAGEIHLIGPAPCFFSRVRGRYRWQIILRGEDPAGVLRRIGLPLPLGWRVDVDPVDLL
ncbi:MAG TPA: primosomal protein N' [Anaerolineae bacterium]|nr:primosomal protein N' [Anaerolineae bacterium]HIQ05052.1 primosomal protein N' [Anaerolineae bacterium]